MKPIEELLKRPNVCSLMKRETLYLVTNNLSLDVALSEMESLLDIFRAKKMFPIGSPQIALVPQSGLFNQVISYSIIQLISVNKMKGF